MSETRRPRQPPAGARGGAGPRRPPPFRAERAAPDARPRPRPAGRTPATRPREAPPALPTAGRLLAEVEELEATIEKLVAGGDGLARWRGIPLFVPRAAPGDRVRLRVVERRPDYGRAEIVELLEPGPGRRTPPCPHFADCGGCDLQHLDDALQLRLKVEAALETLTRLARVELPPPRRIVSGPAWGYRIRTQLHLEKTFAGLAVGYHARASRRLVPIRVCPVLEPGLERFALEIPAQLAGATGPLPARLDLAAGDAGEVSVAPPTPPMAGGEVVRRIGEFDVRFDARTFFQGHGALLGELLALAAAEGSGELAFDLYGGVGLFALPLARRYARVVVVESDRVAARYAAKNARAARLGNVEVVARAVESWAGAGLPSGADRVLVDPPRDGLPREVRRLLVARPARRLTYVSCHAAALARDLAELSAAYRVSALDFVDLFPQTGHLECVLQLAARELP
jgi:23S rRNA (uracil1939-C5)-methyltransferase